MFLVISEMVMMASHKFYRFLCPCVNIKIRLLEFIQELDQSQQSKLKRILIKNLERKQIVTFKEIYQDKDKLTLALQIGGKNRMEAFQFLLEWKSGKAQMMSFDQVMDFYEQNLKQGVEDVMLKQEQEISDLQLQQSQRESNLDLSQNVQIFQEFNEEDEGAQESQNLQLTHLMHLLNVQNTQRGFQILKQELSKKFCKEKILKQSKGENRKKEELQAFKKQNDFSFSEEKTVPEVKNQQSQDDAIDSSIERKENQSSPLQQILASQQSEQHSLLSPQNIVEKEIEDIKFPPIKKQKNQSSKFKIQQKSSQESFQRLEGEQKAKKQKKQKALSDIQEIQSDSPEESKDITQSQLS